MKRLLTAWADPVTRKRWRRFRRHRRAFASLLLLTGLWGVSLGAELIANDRPLYVRFEGRSFFPVFRFYPEDAFLHNGNRTRTDYRALRRHAAFAAAPGNRMIFTPVPFGPFESLDPASLQAEPTVTVSLDRVPRVARVDVAPGDLRVLRAEDAGPFFGADDAAVPGMLLTARGPLPRAFLNALADRSANRAAPRLDVRVPQTSGGALGEAALTLSTFAPRAEPPATVRVLMREPMPEGKAVRIDIGPDGRERGNVPVEWSALDPSTQQKLVQLAVQGHEAPVFCDPVLDRGRLYRVEFRKNDVSWPYGPVRGHWFGVDSSGRDVLARVLYGLRTSLTFGLLLVAASMTLGVIVGAIQGYYGGWVDIAGQRFTEVWSALPFLYIMILLGSVYGRGLVLLLFCYGIFNWIGISYYARAEFFRLRRQPFVDAARCLGVPARRIMSRHILPNALTPVITFVPFSLVGAIGVLAALDYLGFGLPPPTPSWGELLQQAQQFRWAWWLILYPSLAIFTVMLLGVFIGEGVRDAYDPRPFSRME